MHEELVVLVDEQNNEMGTMEKLSAHNANTPLHRAFSLFLFNAQGELMLQQRASTKKTWPLVWSNSCCGHPGPGELTEDAIRRRLHDELGITGDQATKDLDIHVILPTYRYRFERDGIVENEICPVYVGRYDQIPQPNPAEVENISFTPWPDFLKLAETSNRNYSEWSFDEARLLQANKKFQETWHLWYNK